ncbi:PREDICTED: activating transcription factor 7-interacting protein 2 isoform X2 [Galeopterus variegatus]|uniref:Activating transcription factor 7-interacting protein 2 isoform X2 n=1 Tax=Galeopterus variegatus TaxID=482537 RepID=A0ABM0RS86_GALVR|nr:PREDICTED: activating transcription factor 7-interacting protein 2 isoform X2 [Galeopterus variegatus]
MASPDRSKRKILKAKKTMPTSCRKQVEILNKSKNFEALKTTAVGSNVPSGNQNLSIDAVTKKCRLSENVASSLDSNKNSVFSQKSKEFPQNLIKPVEELELETRLEYIDEQVVCPYQKPSKTVNSPNKFFIQEAKDSWNTYENHSENHFEYQANVTRSFSEHEGDCNLKSICCAPIILRDVVQMPKTTVASTLDDKRVDKMVSHLEAKANSESHDKSQHNNFLSSHSRFVPVEKTPNLVNLVTSSICAADILRTEESSRTCHASISNCESTDSTWLPSLDTDSDNSHNQKKRMFSENKESVKRMRTSEQINENGCVVLEGQTALLEQVPNSETMNLDKNQESVNSPVERMTSVNCEPSNPSENASGKISLSLDSNESVSESNDDVMLISVESPSLTNPITSDPTDIRKIPSGKSSDSPNPKTEVVAVEKKKLNSVIDLTKEGLSNCNTESPVSTLESPSKAVSNSKETIPVAQNAFQVLESFEHLPPLPEPPALPPELADKVRDTLPPQKPELKVKRVLRPKGIALTWNITKINPKCAPVESYHLFLCHENPNNKLIWKKIGEIKALPLPMACTLSQFLASSKYYFTIQSKDIFGRYGPFCDIKSITGFSENLT